MKEIHLRTGKELILATKEYAVDHTVKSWWVILSTTFLFLLSLTGTVAHFSLVGRIGCSVIAGFLLLRLFVIYHDQQHRAILSKSRLAAGFMKVFGIVGLSPTSIWTASHNHHHNHNSKLRGSHIGSFPVMTKTNFLNSSRGDQRKYLFMRHPLTILCGYFSVFLFGMCVYPFFDKPREHCDCLVAFVVHVAIAAALLVFLGWQALLLGLIVPWFISSAIGSYLFYAQHNFPEVSFYDKAGWTYEKAALESSSFMRTSRLMAWFSGNIGYHHIHHLNARIPFYRLPEVLAKMPELQSAKTTSLHPRDILHCLRLKVWDVDLQRMVGVAP